jgi:hypothetical protein
VEKKNQKKLEKNWKKWKKYQHTTSGHHPMAPEASSLTPQVVSLLLL